jgi:hypothetical protein
LRTLNFPWVLVLFVFFLISAAGATTTVSNIDQQTGWNSCSACANGGVATYSLTQHQSSPSLDGNSSKFHLGGSTPLSDALWFKRVGYNSTATNFTNDTRYYLKNPSAPTGMEFSVSQHVGTKWYRWDWQCSFYFGVWRTWDNANSKWVNTSAPCKRPSAYSWTHTTFEGHRANGKVYFDAVTVNGHKYYVNKSFYPTTVSYTGNWITLHFQLNGNKTQTDFDVWGDKFNVSYW